MLSNYKIVCSYDPEEIVPLIKNSMGKTRKIEFLGKEIKINSIKLVCFKRYGLDCCKCGMRGEVFRLVEEIYPNESDNVFSLQLFGFNKEHKEVLMTVDHIIPLSKGGSLKSISNLQPMCKFCNTEKGNKLDVL